MTSAGPPSGFTLVELLIVLAVTTLLVAASIPIYGGVQVSAQLNDAAAQTVQALRIARTKAVARTENMSHGVCFNEDGNTVILYQGDSCATRDTAFDRTYTLDDAMTLSTTAPGDDIVFAKGTGVPGASATVTITHSVTGSRVIVLTAAGAAYEQ